MNCPSCPVNGLPCLGTIHPSFCGPVVRDEPGRRAQAWAVARVMAGEPAYPLGPETPADAAAMRADTCPWADPDSPCGCGGPDAPPRRCLRPDRPREVRRPFCLECAAADDWRGPADAAELVDLAADPRLVVLDAAPLPQ